MSAYGPGSSARLSGSGPASAPPSVSALLLAPGAGADRDHSTLKAIDRAVTALPDVRAVERIDFPYRRAGRKSPDKPPVLIQTVRDAAASITQRAGIGPDALALGGRSLGGRMCSMAVAEGLEAACLVLVSYPLHPPGRPENLRTAHLGALGVPCLFISGTRDAFAHPGELEEATATIPGDVSHVWFEGADHALRGHDDEIAQAVVSWITRSA